MVDQAKAQEYIRNNSEAVPWTGCWLWTKKGEFIRGYGSAWHGNKQWRAHRLSYEAFNGAVLEGQVVMHLCNIPACVNPEHLQAGTQAENVAYAYRCKRATREGEKHHMHKLSKEDVVFARYSASCGYAYTRIAALLNVAVATIEDAIHFRTWRNI